MRTQFRRLTASLWLAAYGFFAVGGQGLHVLVEHSHADQRCGDPVECVAVCDAHHSHDHGHSHHHSHDHHHKPIDDGTKISQKNLSRQTKGLPIFGSIDRPGHDHDHCALCQFLGQPVQATQICQFELSVANSEEASVLQPERPSAFCAAPYRSRAPPAVSALSV